MNEVSPTLNPSTSVTRAGVTPVEPEQAWVPRLDCAWAEGAGEDVPADEAAFHL